jgi:hypothetical protein
MYTKHSTPDWISGSDDGGSMHLWNMSTSTKLHSAVSQKAIILIPEKLQKLQLLVC